MPRIIERLSLRKTALRAQVAYGCLTLLGLSLALAAALLITIASHYLHAKRSHQALRLYREVLIAANVISAERGPTNTMLGGDFAPSSEVAQRLIKFRANSNESLQRITQLDPEKGKNELLRTKTELAEARLKVDRLLARPFADRDLGMIREAISGMLNAVDAIRPLINATALETNGSGESLADQALIGQNLFEIRDFAGRLGSILTPYIAKRAAITADDQKRLQQTFGRIRQLWELTRPHLERYPSLSKSIADVEVIFFGDGMDIVDRLEREAATGNFSFTTATMTDAIVPTFAPLEQIRLSYLNLMLEKADRELHSASLWFFWVAVLTVLIVLIDVVLLVGTQRMIFEPLLKARDHIVLLAEDRELDTDLPPEKGRAEIEEVFTALNVLRAKLLERQQLTAQLMFQATTDGLTGLLNRRSFDQRFSPSRDGVVAKPDVGLIIVDIDRFKSINDTYGHATGDTVLKSVAQLLSRNVRSGDIVARFGGEEFAILIENANIEVLRRVAESLREAIADTGITISPDQTLNVTASFGVAKSRPGRSSDDLFRAADKALYAAKSAGRNCVCLEAPISIEKDAKAERPHQSNGS
ncbi:GGDEF domain-containing protein [Neorhizobium sp. NCHU2750]|uniref:GGDEF domain-containing protein n=1 Tax=Neorhizobium sp. NCHU2750 TaxID=1825976 RepID=UPI0013C4133D